MNVFRRKKTWQHVVGEFAVGAADNPAVKAGAGAFAGLMTVTAASAVVSSIRRKLQA
jgi:hypothetical protein